MADAQTGNTQAESPDVDILNIQEQAQGDTDYQAFFDDLDRQVNSAVYEDEITQPTSNMTADNKVGTSPDVSSAENISHNPEVDNLQNERRP